MIETVVQRIILKIEKYWMNEVSNELQRNYYNGNNTLPIIEIQK